MLTTLKVARALAAGIRETWDAESQPKEKEQLLDMLREFTASVETAACAINPGSSAVLHAKKIKYSEYCRILDAIAAQLEDEPLQK